MKTHARSSAKAKVIEFDAARSRRSDAAHPSSAVRTSIRLEVNEAGEMIATTPMKIDERDALMMLAASLELTIYLLDVHARGVSHV